MTSKTYMLCIYISLLITILGCKHKSKDSNYRIIEKKSYTVAFPEDAILQKNQILSFSKFYGSSDGLYAYFYDWVGKNLYLTNIENQKLSKTINLKSIDSLLLNQKRGDMKFINDTTLALFSYIEQKLILLNLKGEVIKSYSTKPTEETNVEALSYWDRQWDYFKGKFHFIKIYTDFVLNSKENMKKYFSRKGELILDVSNDEVAFSESLDFPSNLQNGEYYGDTDFYRCINNNGEKVYSFTANDSLFVYNKDKLVRKVYAGSKHNPKFNEFDVSRALDMNYSSQYITEEPRYQKIIFDRYRNLYYRAFKERSEYINENNKKKRSNEIPWSLIVLDSSLNIKSEIEMNPSKYSMSVIYPTEDGIVLYNSVENSLKDKAYHISLIEIKEDHE